ncbi:glutathione S-transferase [Terasakiella brassicae]|uniref:Glutathione S-transferase n=1 Tax=Terasakiella brassicae TaxID=1634917 RepID=A0A917F829_9PROT|nr:glutathione S-transferase family protein [Terasakiella brassicae]GGF55710.1 glutathione S-transferase [Terasakiella brassicae]
MSALCLILGNKNYSSWSLRPWLVMKHLGLDFDEIIVPLLQGNFKEELFTHSPSGKVPVLKVDGQEIWDSLAICEYLNEEYPDANLWPIDKSARAHARSISYEMHSGFFNIRNDMPMNMRRARGNFHASPLCQAEIDRILAIWTDCRKNYGQNGPFLFGDFSIADAMFAPVVSRFDTYGVAVDGVVKDYMETILNMAHLKEWRDAGKVEEWIIDEAEI